VLFQTQNMKNLFKEMAKIEASVNDSKVAMGIICGNFGRGKTTILSHYASIKPQAKYLRAMDYWDARTMSSDICKELALPTNIKHSERVEEIILYLKYNHTILIIDEMNKKVDSRPILETLRDIHDRADNTPIILAGTEELWTKAKRDGSLWDRFRIKMKFLPFSADDIALFAQNHPAIEITKECAELIAKQTTSLRPMMNLLESIESKCLANNIKTVDVNTFRSLNFREDDE